MKKLFMIGALAVVALFAAVIPAGAQTSGRGDWMLYNTFSYYQKKVIDTKDRVYFLSQGQFSAAGKAFHNSDAGFLFVYDKKSDELTAYNSRNYLHDDGIVDMFYNPADDSLMIVYENANIDILHGDNSVYNIPGLKSAILTYTKRPTDVTFDNANHLAYMAMPFGYMVIDTKKNVIKESHIYGQEITCIARVGNDLVAATPSGLFASPVSDPHTSWSVFTPVTVDGSLSGTPKYILPLDGDKMGIISTGGFYTTGLEDGVITPKQVANTPYTGYHPNRDGYFMYHNWIVAQVKRDGTSPTRYDLPSTQRYASLHSSWDYDTVWFAEAVDGTHFDGFTCRSINKGNWVQNSIGDHGMVVKPHAPVTYRAFTFDYSPRWGMLMINNGPDRVNTDPATDYIQAAISAHNSGEWNAFGCYITPVSAFNKNYAMTNPYGVAVDPYDENTIYFGTYHTGLTRLNMDNNDIKIYSMPGDALCGALDCFYPVFAKSSWQYCKVSNPKFDADGTLWVLHDSQSTSGGYPLYYWKKDARLANRTSEFKSIPVPGYKTHNNNKVLPLVYSSHRNMLVMANRTTEGAGFYVFDHNGTLDDTSDDRLVSVDRIVDRNGNTLTIGYIYEFVEDPETGLVWLGSSDGVFNFDPSQAFKSDFRVNRIKVARNDGTNLADYLLDGVPVHGIAIDGAGRKWFATLGNGVTVTSADGAEVLKTYTSENSDLLDNIVYGIGAQPDSNVIWMGTQKGVCSFFSDATPGAEKYDNVVAYPNPVRPDYYGYVTIEGLMDSSLVKILDASGNLVKELGVSQGGMITWDVTNMESRRVKTGVYHIAASNTQTGEGSVVGRILVVN